MVESQPSKLLVAGSIPVSRSSSKFENGNSKFGLVRRETSFDFPVSIAAPCGAHADVAQLVEHVLGKDGVSGSIPLIGSRVFRRSSVCAADRKQSGSVRDDRSQRASLCGMSP